MGIITIALVLALQSNTILGHEDSCETLAGLASVVVEFKNRGLTWEDMKPAFTSAVAESKGKEDSLVVNDDDEKLVMSTLEAVYSSPLVKPKQAAYDIYKACMAVKHGPIL